MQQNLIEFHIETLQILFSFSAAPDYKMFALLKQKQVRKIENHHFKEKNFITYYEKVKLMKFFQKNWLFVWQRLAALGSAWQRCLPDVFFFVV